MNDSLRIDIDGADGARRKLAQLSLFLSDLRPFWPRLVPLFIQWMNAQFASEGGWGGQQWAPLSPTYAAIKARLFPGRSILIASGDLRQAASRPERDVGPGHLTLRIASPVAGYHQEGTDRLPPRPLIPDRLPATALLEVEREAEDYIRDLVRRLGL